MDKQLRSKIQLRNPVHFLALGFGSGLAPFMPGTFGTLAAIPLFWLMSDLSIWIYAAITLLVCIFGVSLCAKTAEDMGVHDHGAIVWDEIAGYLITMAAVPFHWIYVVLGFALFRFFDIVKPWPISYLDKNIHGGLGIMADDILAGVFAFACLQALIYFTPI
ncbi:phosphatidylglycerophosphatase A [Alteromonadaceae bacterium BrNp21-10]|nr:phosphatidylglycerophosphatase A [Alteromonadaceae bacterium BrNp21-10]